MNATIHTSAAPQTREYRLMYLFGAWVTKEVIYAESDAEAVFDADMTFASSNLGNWRYGVALFCGNRMVKHYLKKGEEKIFSILLLHGRTGSK